MILVDSSVWIDYFRGAEPPEAEWLDALLGREPVATGDLVLTEVWQRFRSERDFNQAKTLLTSLVIVDLGGQDIAIQVAKNVRALRALGVTVRKTIDTVMRRGALRVASASCTATGTLILSLFTSTCAQRYQKPKVCAQGVNPADCLCIRADLSHTPLESLRACPRESGGRLSALPCGRHGDEAGVAACLRQAGAPRKDTDEGTAATGTDVGLRRPYRQRSP